MSAERLAAAFGNFCDLVRDHARTQPSRAAIIQGDRVLDYAALDAAMDRLAAFVQSRNAGEAVALCGGSSIEYLLVFLASLRAGPAAALVSPALPPRAVARMIADSGARLAFLDAAAGRAVRLDGPVEHLARHARGGDLDHRDLRPRGLVAHGVHHPRGLQSEQARLLDLEA